MKVEIELTEREYEVIENAFKLLKKGKSNLKTKEDMCKLILMKDCQAMDLLYTLGDFTRW